MSDEVEGTLVLADVSMRSLEWHHSVDFDGYTHTTACSLELDCRDEVRDVMLEPREDWRKEIPPADGCPTCHKSVMGRLETPFEGIVVDTDPLVVDDGSEKRTIDDVDEDHGLGLGEAVRVEPDGIRILDYNPVSTDEGDN